MSFIQICEFPDNPVTAENRQDKKSIQLLNTFLLGPSSKNCRIDFVDALDESDSEQNSDQDSEQSPSQSDTPQQQSSQSQDDSTGNNSTDNNSFIRRNYSILEAYSYLHRVFEAEPSENNTQDSSQQSSGSTNQSSQDNDNQDENKPLTNDASTKLRVKVSLSKEGYSVWTILLDSKVGNVGSVKAAIKSGNFNAARTLAIKTTNPACFIVSKLETYVSTDSSFTMNAPFIGRCRYAMDSGSDKDSSEDNSVCIAIAPIDGRTKKPSEKTVFKVLYNVLDMSKLTSGAVKSFDDKVPSESEDNKFSSRRGGADSQNALSVWINKKFKNDGDSKEYNNFLKLRKFIADNLKANTIEYDSTNSDNIKTYGNLSAVETAITAY